MPWIKTGVSSKDSLAAREDDEQHTGILEHTRRRETVPVTFFTDLRGTQRMIRESTRNPNNPFYQTRNPLPVGFGLGGVSELTDARSEGTRSGWIQEPEPVRTPRIARHPEGARERPVVQCGVTPRSGNIVRELVAMEVDEVIARRAAQNTAGRRTVAAAMKWILDSEPGASGAEGITISLLSFF